MRKYLAFVAFLILPLAFGYVLHEQLLDWEKYSQWAGATGVISLALLSLAAISRELCRVVLWIPREEALTRASLLGTYLFAGPHVGLFVSTWNEAESIEDRNSAWRFAWALGIAALLLLLAVPLRRHLLRSALAIPRWTVLLAASMALLHGRLLGLVVGRADENDRWFSNQLAWQNGHYAIPIFLGVWILLALFNRFQVRFTSPIPRFSLLTLLLIPCAGFSGVVLHKHWMPWSVERTLAQAEEITNPWGSFIDPVAALSPDGSMAFSSTPEGPALLWNCSAGTSQELRMHAGPVEAARFSPDGSKLAVVTKAFCLFQRETEAAPYILKRAFRAQADVPANASAQLSGDTVIETEWGVLWLYDCARLNVLGAVAVGTVDNAAHTLADFSFSADSSRLLTLSTYQGAYLWDTASCKLLTHRNFSTPDLDRGDRERALCLRSAQGWRLILETPDLGLGEFAVHTPALQKIWTHLRSFNHQPSLNLSPDHATLILAHQSGNVDAVNVRDGTTRWTRTLKKSNPDVYSQLSALCFDSECVLTRYDLNYEAFSLANGSSVFKLRAGAYDMNRVFPDNVPTFIFTEPHISVFDPYTFQTALIFDRDEEGAVPFFAVGQLALSADSQTILNTGSHGSVRLWKQRHPGQWWGIAVLPEFWLTLLFSGALLWSIVRDRRLNVATPSGVPARI